MTTNNNAEQQLAYNDPKRKYQINYAQLDAVRTALLTGKFAFESMANSSILFEMRDIFERYAQQMNNAYESIQYDNLRANE